MKRFIFFNVFYFFSGLVCGENQHAFHQLSESSQKVDTFSSQKLTIILKPGAPAQFHEIRKFFYPQGYFSLELSNLPRKILENSILSYFYTENEIDLLYQSFSFIPFSYKKLLRYFIGKDVEMMQRLSSGEEKFTTAKLLGIDEEEKPIVLSDKGIDCHFPGSVIFPVNLLKKDKNYFCSTLFLQLFSKKKGNCEFHLDYLTEGFLWEAYYLMRLDLAKKNLFVEGIVNLSNLTGIKLEDVRLMWSESGVAKEKLENLPNDYKLLSSFTLDNNEKKAIPFFSKKFQPSLTYHIEFPEWIKGVAEVRKIEAERRLLVTKEQVSLESLPNGMLNFFILNDEHIPLYVSTQPFKKRIPRS